MIFPLNLIDDFTINFIDYYCKLLLANKTQVPTIGGIQWMKKGTNRPWNKEFKLTGIHLESEIERDARDVHSILN